ncbi:MAG: hypothetical protein RLZZ336_2030 [Cyanobacteriota bacterium]|jgi:Ca2+-transporting ATPase
MLLSAAHPIWTLSDEAVLAATGSSRQGLSSAEAQRRLAQFGANALPPQQQRSLVVRLGDQLLHPMALLAGAQQLTVAIWVMELINGSFSFWQEDQAERTMAALIRALPRQVQLWRDGSQVQPPAETVVAARHAAALQPLEQDLSLGALLGLKDRLRPEDPAAIQA